VSAPIAGTCLAADHRSDSPSSLICAPPYFDDPEASRPTDVAREAADLTAWWNGRRGVPGDAERIDKEATILGFLASDLQRRFDPDDPFVEKTTARFLLALDLPVPDELPPP
jgi:hypothetical protein